MFAHDPQHSIVTAHMRTATAYESTIRLSFDQRAGLLMRQVHHWAALVFLFAILLHLLRVWGPSKLMALLGERGLGGRLPTRFIRHSICNLCFTLFSDPALCTAITQLCHDTELVEETAYARLYYLSETQMVERVVADR